MREGASCGVNSNFWWQVIRVNVGAWHGDASFRLGGAGAMTGFSYPSSHHPRAGSIAKKQRDKMAATTKHVFLWNSKKKGGNLSADE